ncbi:MAG TPA: tripartite tricarboxylate transporter substrate binding protein [Alphaproteobacteria bacterium]|nr:tripartite tricarboxylate transporter substrate binding protein [Alphaproteobacteria bacterium]
MKFVKAALVAATLAFAAAPVWAQSYPDHPVRVTAAFPPGSGVDIVARIVSDKLNQVLNQPFVVENRVGAGGTIAEALVAKSAPDGYTVLVNSSSHSANSLLYANLSYDPLTDLVAVSPLAILPNVLVVDANNTKGLDSVAKLVAYGKAHPGQLTYASAGVGSATHMNDEKFRIRAGIEAVHVPFKGTPEAMSDIMAGRVDYMFTPIVSAISLIKSGKLKALSVAAAQRSPELPDVPTTTEAGVADSDYVFWVAMLAPAKTPPAVIDKLNETVAKVLALPDVKEKLGALGATPYVMKPAAFQAVIQKEFTENTELVKKAGIKAN